MKIVSDFRPNFLLGSTIQVRFIIAGMIGIACLVYALNRGNMSIIILAMTKNAYNSSIELPDVMNERKSHIEPL